MTIKVNRDYPVCTIILDNPESKNAIDGETATALAKAFREFDADERALVAVLWGANETFCSGANLKALANGKGNRIAKTGDAPLGPTRMLLSKPVIAAVSGYAVAGGLELACWCDLRIAEKSAIFGVFCRRFGVPLIDGGTVRLPRLIGTSRTMDMILTGRPVDAYEALSWGLVNRVVDDGQSRQVSEKLAKKIAKYPQNCMRNDRLSVLTNQGKPVVEAMQSEFEYGLKTLGTGEFLSGSDSFTNGKGKHGVF